MSKDQSASRNSEGGALEAIESAIASFQRGELDGWELDLVRRRIVALSERPRWIPVSERLPALDGPDILIAGRNDGVRIWQASPYGPNDPSWIERYEVTHWADMSIVPLPNERNSGT